MFAKFKIPFKVLLRRFKQLSFFVSILLSKKRDSEKPNNDAVHRPEEMQPQKEVKTINPKKIKKIKKNKRKK